jgi:hypothetical protein
MTIRPELFDELLKDYQTPQDLFGENGILKQLTKGMIERCLQAEMEEHHKLLTLPRECIKLTHTNENRS